MLNQALMIVLLFICTYCLVDRVCKCIEHCAMGKAYQAATKSVEALKYLNEADDENV